MMELLLFWGGHYLADFPLQPAFVAEKKGLCFSHLMYTIVHEIVCLVKRYNVLSCVCAHSTICNGMMVCNGLCSSRYGAVVVCRCEDGV